MSTANIQTIRTLIFAVAMLAAGSRQSLAVATVALPNNCSDRNALQNIAIDARLNAIKFYYQGFIQNTGDRDRKRCLEAHVLLDDHLAVINHTSQLIQSKCLPIDAAARMATEGLCP